MDLATPAILLALVLGSALFSGSEAALFSLSRVQIRQIEAKGDRAARCVLSLLRAPQRLLHSLLVGGTLLNIGISAVVTVLAIHRFGGRGVQIAIPAATLLILTLCEILPKTIAVNFPRLVSRAGSGPLVLILPVLSPMTWAMSGLSRGLLALLGLPAAEGGSNPRLTSTELRAALEDADTEGGMSKLESRLVQNILSFSRTTAEEVMTPRVDIVAAPLTASPEELRALIARTKHARIPLYQQTLDGIAGYLPSRELLLDPTRRLANLIRPVLVVPEKAGIDRVFHDLRKGRWQLAVVVNEYGETVGIITQEDLIEEIVGELYDEYEPSITDFVELAPDVYEVRGRISLQDLGERLEVGLPQDAAVTVNGFLCALYGGFPRPGTVLRWESLQFEILEVARHRVSRVRVTRRPSGGDE